MRIIKYHALDSDRGMNSVAISPNEQFIAFGDSSSQITVYNYQNLLVFYKTKSDEKIKLMNISKDINCYALSTISIPKLPLNFHTDAITALCFSNTYDNFLLSGSYDKNVSLWIINKEYFSAKIVTSIELKGKITDMRIYPDDSHLITSCYDNKIYIIKCNLLTAIFEVVSALNLHDNIVNSIALDPMVINNGNFVSISDQGKVVIASYDKNNKNVKVIYNYEDFNNVKHTCALEQKKIDWSIDGKWIITVDHHLIRNQDILHAKLINMESPKNYQALIGHESPVLIAKFSKCLYSINKGELFQLCATADKNGNLIIWKVQNDAFSVIVEINNYSESKITDMLWSLSGNYLFTVNSIGSVCAIEFNEFDIKGIQIVSLNNGENILNQLSSIEKKGDSNIKVKNPKKEIKNNSLNLNNKKIEDANKRDIKEINVQQSENAKGDNEIIINDNTSECLKCKRKLYQVDDNKFILIPIDSLFTKDKFQVFLSWENKLNENMCIVKLGFNNTILYSNKFLNRMIKLFISNSLFYAFYDTNFTLNVHSILNTPLLLKIYFEEICLMRALGNYVLLLTTQNRLIIINVFTKEKITDEYLNINNSPGNIFQTKIHSIDFVSLHQIFIKAETFNPYQNRYNKLILYFDQKNNNLILSSHEDFMQEERDLIANQKKERNKYNNYFEQNIYEYKHKIPQWEIEKICGRLNAIYDNMYRNYYLKRKDIYMNYVNEMIGIVRDKIFEFSNLSFRYIIDDFVALSFTCEYFPEINAAYLQFNKEISKMQVNFSI